MKKLLLSIFVAAGSATAANAQIAPEVGLNMANMTFKTAGGYIPPGTAISTSLKTGFTVGIIRERSLTDNLFLQPGLFYLMNGCNFTGGGSYNINTVQIPINIAYKPGQAGSNRFFFGGGPYIGYNISGTLHTGGSSKAINISLYQGYGLKPFDGGLGINAGVLLLSDFYFRLHYQRGLINLRPGGDANNSTKTSAISITLGYYFGSKYAEESKDKE